MKIKGVGGAYCSSSLLLGDRGGEIAHNTGSKSMDQAKLRNKNLRALARLTYHRSTGSVTRSNHDFSNLSKNGTKCTLDFEDNSFLR
ncbi:Hypothetical predicted protein [Cloeon dipterum]|uniref:Uncharacterized protein n=1 Tax=Cloeon dipterum TaxID=197152 RepID=A0A8S1CHG7_9INSE|nr:Hypothetical predicted protein [Cloeon dipterum]